MRAYVMLLRCAVPVVALALGCGRSELEGEIPDGGVAVDVPFDRGDTPPPPDAPDGGGRCFANLDCDDGVFCNGAEACADGRCVAGAPINCDDGIDCTVDSCNKNTGACVHKANNTLCDNGLLCDGQETCNVKTGCVAGTPVNCDDGNPCTADTCDPSTRCAPHTGGGGYLVRGLQRLQRRRDV